MNNRVLVGGLIGGIVFFFLGYLIYGMALATVFEENTLEGVARSMDDFQWAFLILGNLFFGFLLAYVLDKANSLSFGTGATVGAIVGLLVGLAVNFTMYGTSHTHTLTGHFVDIIGLTIMSAIAGGIIGWWYGRGRTVVVTDTTRRM